MSFLLCLGFAFYCDRRDGRGALVADCDGYSERSLRLLFDHRYLDRPASQRIGLAEEGPRPFVYGLGKKGAQALRQHGI